MLNRLLENPLLAPSDVEPTRDDLHVLCTLNPGTARYENETILLVRVGERVTQQAGYVSYIYFDEDSQDLKVGHYSRKDPKLSCPDGRLYHYDGKMVLTSMSHLRVARSSDGINFKFDDQPAIYPANAYEAYGCEDPRITKLGDTFYITYTAVSGRGVTVALVSTKDFITFRRHGIIFPPYQKDVVIFPEKIQGKFVCRHRPYKSEFNQACIWTAYSPDLFSWGFHDLTLSPRADTWDSERVGCGGVPIKTEQGWLEIYHASDNSGKYHLGAMLSDLEEPHKVIARGDTPVFEPQAEYELDGIYGNCVFTNGLIAEPDGELKIYYGAADRICACALTTIDEMIAAALNKI